MKRRARWQGRPFSYHAWHLQLLDIVDHRSHHCVVGIDGQVTLNHCGLEEYLALESMAPYDVSLASHTCPSCHDHGYYHVGVEEVHALGGHDGDDDVLYLHVLDDDGVEDDALKNLQVREHLPQSHMHQILHHRLVALHHRLVEVVLHHILV